jgi:murein DD-endopeptidase MepM/ murein hydrolase activator NlpD
MRITALICISLPLLFPLYGSAQFNTLGISTGDITPVVTSVVIPSETEKREKVSIQIAEIPAEDGIRFPPPFKNIHITSGAGCRKHPVTGQLLFHSGIDLRADHEPVYVVMDGVVEAVGDDDRSGKWVKMQHADRIRSSYAHLSRLYVTKGDKVSAGDVLGISGNTGRSTGPHLHFSMKK